MNIIITHIHVLATQMAKTVPGYDGPIMENTSQVKTLWAQSLTHTSEDDDHVDENEKLTKEQEELLEWLNQKLSITGNHDKPIETISSLKSGVVLISLLCVLTQQTDIKERAEMKPNTLWHRMQNAFLICNFLTQQTFHQFENCTAQDIVLGDVNRISSLLSFLRDKFDLEFLFIKMMNEGVEDPSKAISFKDLEYDQSQVKVLADLSIETPSPIERKRKKKKRSSADKKSRRASLNLGEDTKRRSKSAKTPSPRRSKNKDKKEPRIKSVKLDKATTSKLPTTEKSTSAPSVEKKKKERRSRSSLANDGSASISKKARLESVDDSKISSKPAKSKSKKSSPLVEKTPLKRSGVLLRQASVTVKYLEKERIEKAQLAVRQRIVQELHDTEFRYVEGLQCLCSHLLSQLKENAVLLPKDYDAVFANVESLLAYHHGLSATLKKIVDSYSNTTGVAEEFYKSVSFYFTKCSHITFFSNFLKV